MELKIEEKLQELYKHIQIEVEYIDWRKYKINVKIKIGNLEYSKEIIHIYGTHIIHLM